VRRSLVLSFALVALLLAGGLAGVSTPAHTVGGAAPPPPARAYTAARPADLGCPTPDTPGSWSTPDYATDIETIFTVPGDPGGSGPGFQTVQCSNTIPTYTQGFWMNISTDVPILQALVTIWAVDWPTATNPTPYPAGFLPSQPAHFDMLVNPQYPNVASFYFNCYRYFEPGSQVFFNVSVNSSVGTPNRIFSASPLAFSQNETYDGIVDNASWIFDVASPWSSTNFSTDIAVSTSPPAIGVPFPYDPNPEQALQVTLTSKPPLAGGAPPAIGVAQLDFNVTGGPSAGGPFNELFTPVNETVANLTTPLGPYFDGTIKFQVIAWSLWAGTRVDPIRSPLLSINWTRHGGWWYPSLGLAANLEVNATPDVLTGGTNTLPTGTPVNVSIHSPLPNVTIGSGGIAFRYTDVIGYSQGVLPMQPINGNTSYAIIPGLPPGGHLTFSVLAKDIFGTSISSGNYTYSEPGSLVNAPPSGTGYVYLEAVDVTTGALVPSVNYTIANATWSERAVGTPLGFAFARSPAGGNEPYPLTDGSYTATISAFGETPSGVLVVSSGSPVVMVFDVASGALPNDVLSQAPVLAWDAAFGLIAAVVATPFILLWFRERRRRLEAEQRRVTLG
jgi:hypothetical protein